MPAIRCAVPAKSISLDAVVVRCGCSDEMKGRPDWHGKRGVVCPNPRRVEDLGRIAFWHRNIVRRALYRVGRFIRAFVPKR